jgi:hypothetical protein
MQNFNYTVFTSKELHAMFSERNNAGLGYDGDDVTGEHVAHTDELDVYDTGSHYVLLGDANGPWAVAVGK